MKKKLLMVAVIVALLVCALAVSASASANGSASNEYGTPTIYDSIVEKDKLDTTSRVVLVNADGTYSTYPAYYILKNDLNSSLDFTALNTATGESYSNKSVVRIEFPNAIKQINGSMFDENKALIEVDLPSSLESVQSRAFYNCINLQYIDGTEGLLIFPEGFTRIAANNAFYNCDKIKYVEFPSTFTYLGQAAFHDCDGLLLASFDKVNEAINNGTRTARVDFNNCGSFKYCDNLVALSLPELTTTAINRLACGCTNLTAVYLPDSIVEIGTNANGQGAFDDCTKMYFVQESFTVSQCIVDGQVDLSKLDLPEKPAVYYMPTSFTKFIGHVDSNQWSKGGTIFRNCTSLNDTIVFGEAFTFFNGYNVMQGVGTKDSPKNVVFLADMTEAITLQNTSYINFYFANPADKSPADIGLKIAYKASNTTETYWYFCNGGARYTYAIQEKLLSDDIAVNLETILTTKDEVNFVHAAEKQGESDATCTLPAGLHTYCFCGKVAYSEYVEGSVALGHDTLVANGAIDLGIAYINFFENGAHSYECARCGEACVEETEALFVWKGYTVSVFGDTFAMAQGFAVNSVAVEAYKEYDAGFEFGLIAAGNKNENGEAFAPELSGDLCIPQSKIAHDYFDIKIAGITDTLVEKQIVFCAYVKAQDKVYYLDNETTSEAVTGISYNTIVGLLG
ncbi:MAG: leucine-rich repeat domain-containing protein [Clostridia bacterium]|nr:leucine-rich repeat domain-containing protein [Clostridia bacterium]